MRKIFNQICLLIFIGSLSVLTQCNGHLGKSTNVENYNEFYSRFHSDSLFQLSRISFPIGGFILNEDGEPEPWTKENWLMHRIKATDIDTTLFKVQITQTPDSVSELIYIEDGGFMARRTFKLKDGKWYLVFYSDEDL